MSNGIKKIALVFGVFFILTSIGINKAEARQNKGISLQVFYDELSGYGDWVDNPDYGYVWRPNVGRDFKPYYTNGHWVMTEYGNTWVSDYDWGWAPFHYGRWFYDSYDGWIWAPDTEWGPAWVTWRTGGGYYGWAPLAPRMSINVNFGRHYRVPDNYWVFIPQRCIYYPSYSRYWEPRRNVYIVNNTTIINNIYTNDRVRYYSGPGRDDVRRATHSEVPIYRISDNARPGSDRISRDEVNIYRPSVDRSGNSAPRSIASNSARPSRGDSNDSRTVNNTDRSGSTSSSARPDRSGVTNDNSRTQNSVDRSGTDRSATGNSSSRPERSAGTDDNSRNQNSGTRTETDRGSNGNTSSRPERTEAPRPTEPAQRTESTRSSAPSPSPQRSEAPSGRPQRVEQSAPAQRTESSAPSRSAERSSAPSSSGGSSRDGGSGRPSR